MSLSKFTKFIVIPEDFDVNCYSGRVDAELRQIIILPESTRLME